MEHQRDALPPPRGYVAGALSNVWAALRALARALVPHTADDSARAPRSTPLITNPSSTHTPAPGARAASPPRPAAPPQQQHAQHGALIDLAEGLERAVLAPPPPGAKGSIAAAHEEMEAERVADPLRRGLVAP